MDHARRDGGTVRSRAALVGAWTAAVALLVTGCGTATTGTTVGYAAVDVTPSATTAPTLPSALHDVLPQFDAADAADAANPVDAASTSTSAPLSAAAAPQPSTVAAPTVPDTTVPAPTVPDTTAPEITVPAGARRLTADVSPFGGTTVGVGQPIVVNLSAAVKAPADRAAVERALVVETSKDVGPASWAWISSTRLDYRPQDFWPSGTAVTVHVNLTGVQAGKDLWGAQTRDVRFSIGRSFVMRIDNAKHTMSVVQDGVKLRTVPVSMGRKGYETRSGIKTVMSHDRQVHMTSASYGGADFYDEIVDYAQRLTWSGEYIHSAPWSVYAQGKRNVSHGCVNVSPSNAVWLFRQTLVGDPVITTGTTREMEPGNGDGGDWQYTWPQWTALSALSSAPAATGL